MAGDVEVNPGPLTRTCPMCLASVHIRKLQCKCGHIFLFMQLTWTGTKRAFESGDTAAIRKQPDRAAKQFNPFVCVIIH